MAARVSSIFTFINIVRDNFNVFRELEKEWKELLRKQRGSSISNFDENILSVEREMGKIGVIVIVFSAMALEAYIYDYAARHLSDKYVRDHLDKLDTVSKWVIVPKLITGKELHPDSDEIRALRSLIKSRNAIVHEKSKPLPDDQNAVQEFLKQQKKKDMEFLGLVKGSVSTLDKLSMALHSIDDSEPAELYLRILDENIFVITD